MKSYLQQVARVGVLIAASVVLGACGGGDDSPSAVIEVVTVQKYLSGSDNAVIDTVAPLTKSGINIIARKCAPLKDLPDGGIHTLNLSFVVLVDISAKDVPAAQALGFSLTSPSGTFFDTTYAC